MSNVIGVLKQEIDRLAAKQAESQISKARRAAAEYRHKVAALKRLLREKEREIARLKKSQQTPIDDDPLAGVRFSARSVLSQRLRLGLSVESYAKLVGVSVLTLRHWEGGRARPRKVQLARLVALRGIPKHEALQRLAALESFAVSVNVALNWRSERSHLLRPSHATVPRSAENTDRHTSKTVWCPSRDNSTRVGRRAS
jgi:DNA-binding transcriptional regulator YiaG